ncbi:uncharacterized protein LOC125681624 isoform X4 [Ostrea edulis]|uniref:uncharacterized protein LOC125681624 isoform X4 n=1 Tax=Ostrea edulis TaxID=37623 RepID=UPI0024AF96DD|nr:uncharacterized protein LOC125681624 isoform X4 [Ostrea edulis]
MRTIILFHCILSAFTISPNDWQHPHYRCLENDCIELTGLHIASTIKLDGDSGCDDTHYTAQTQPVIISYKCLNNKTEGYSSVNIIVYDPIFDGTKRDVPDSTTTTETATAMYRGGHGAHKFTIMCKDIPNDEVTQNIEHVFDYADSVDPDTEANDIEMRFKDDNSMEAQDINNIYIGTQFYMYIKYIGNMDV